MARKCGSNNIDQFRNDYKGCVEEAMSCGKPSREAAWSESVAVGGKVFIDSIKEKLGVKATGRKTVKMKDDYILNEPSSSYKADFVPQMGSLIFENMHHWDNYRDIPNC